MSLENKKTKKIGFFPKLENFLLLRGFLNHLPSKYIIESLAIFIICIIYIANSHFYDRTVRKLNRFQQEVEALRVDYTIIKAEYMFDSKRSEVAKRLLPYGIEIPNHPPYTIDNKPNCRR